MSRIRDLERERPSAAEPADVCIVGAGAAGIVLAVELLRLGKRVTLLEGGGAEIEEGSQEPYQSEVVGLRHAGIHTGRFRAKGGSTTRWGGQILELNEADFERRPSVPGSGWPFAKSELTRFYARALELEGLNRVIGKDDDVWNSLRESAPDLEDMEAYFSRWCPEPNFGRLHRETLTGNPRCDVWLHANAVDLLMEGERATGVRCRTLGGAEAIFTATEYVFCLGGIESIRFFLQPRGVALPWNRCGLLGKNFQDHIDARCAEVVPVDARRFHGTFDNVFLNGLKYQLKLRLSQARQAELGTLNVAGNMIFISRNQETLDRIKETGRHLLRGRFAQVEAANLVAMAANMPLLLRQAFRYGVQHRLFNPPDAQVALRVWCEQEPLSGSSVTLSDARDSLGLLRTRLDWRISDRELDTMRKYVEVASESLRDVATLRPDEDLMAGNQVFLDRCDDCNHHMSGMRMSASESEGVVDPNLRLYGTANTYICSAAVFPTSGYSNPTHTLLSLAVRLAEHIARSGTAPALA